jgi:DNA invertase Pin-like site-specific DNA recombinase
MNGDYGDGGEVISLVDAGALAGYVRTSWQNETAVESAERQRAEIERWAENNNFYIVGFQDLGVPGDWPIEKRPALARAIAAIEGRQLGGLIIRTFEDTPDDYERLSKSESVQEEILARIWDAGGEFYTTLHGRIPRDYGSISRISNRRERGRRREDYLWMLRVKRQAGRDRKKALQGYLGGQRFGGRPYGREIAPSPTRLGIADYRPVPAEQAVIRRICAWHAEGIGYCEIARRLNAEGIPTVTGVPWVHKVVRDLVLRGPIGLSSVLSTRRGGTVWSGATQRESRSA